MANPGLNGLIVGVLIVGIAMAMRNVVGLIPEVHWVNSFRRHETNLETAPPRLVAPMATLLRDRPDSVALTVAMFGMLVWAVSHLKVVRTVAGIADRYFEAEGPTVARLWPFPRFQVAERKLALWMIVCLIVLNQAQVGINVRLSFFSRDWFNAIQNKDEATFWTLLFTVFLFWAVIYLVSATGKPYIMEVNPNPDFSPMAGLAGGLISAGLTHAGFTVDLVRRAPLPIIPVRRRPLDEAFAALTDLKAGKVTGRVILAPTG